MKCEAIYVNSPGYSVRKMCRALGLKEATYYNWKKAEARRRERIKNEERDIRVVQEAFKDSNSTYGCRRIREALQKKGKEMSEWKIRRIMRENGFYPVQLKKYRPGKHERSDGKYCENIVKQQFRPEKMNEIWAGDITYLKTKLGWVYLAIVMGV